MATRPFHELTPPKTHKIRVTVYGQDITLDYDAYTDEYRGDRHDAAADRWYVLYKDGSHYHVQENLQDGNIADIGDYPDFLSALAALASAGQNGATYPVYDMSAVA